MSDPSHVSSYESEQHLDDGMKINFLESEETVKLRDKNRRLRFLVIMLSALLLSTTCGLIVAYTTMIDPSTCPEVAVSPNQDVGIATKIEASLPWLLTLTSEQISAIQAIDVVWADAVQSQSSVSFIVGTREWMSHIDTVRIWSSDGWESVVWTHDELYYDNRASSKSTLCSVSWWVPGLSQSNMRSVSVTVHFMGQQATNVVPPTPHVTDTQSCDYGRLSQSDNILVPPWISGEWLDESQIQSINTSAHFYHTCGARQDCIFMLLERAYNWSVRAIEWQIGHSGASDPPHCQSFRDSLDVNLACMHDTTSRHGPLCWSWFYVLEVLDCISDAMLEIQRPGSVSSDPAYRLGLSVNVRRSDSLLWQLISTHAELVLAFYCSWWRRADGTDRTADVWMDWTTTDWSTDHYNTMSTRDRVAYRLALPSAWHRKQTMETASSMPTHTYLVNADRTAARLFSSAVWSEDSRLNQLSVSFRKFAALHESPIWPLWGRCNVRNRHSSTDRDTITRDLDLNVRSLDPTWSQQTWIVDGPGELTALYGSNPDRLRAMQNTTAPSLIAHIDGGGEEAWPDTLSNHLSRQNDSFCMEYPDTAKSHTLFVSGHPSINQDPPLVVWLTVFMRIHNEAVGRLSLLYPANSDDSVFAMARIVTRLIWVAAQMNVWQSVELSIPLPAMDIVTLFRIIHDLSLQPTSSLDPHLPSLEAVLAFSNWYPWNPSLVSDPSTRWNPDNLLHISTASLDDAMQSLRGMTGASSSLYNTHPSEMNGHIRMLSQSRAWGLQPFASYRKAQGWSEAMEWSTWGVDIGMALRASFNDPNDIDVYIGMFLEAEWQRTHQSELLPFSPTLQRLLRSSYLYSWIVPVISDCASIDSDHTCEQLIHTAQELMDESQILCILLTDGSDCTTSFLIPR